MIRMGRRLWTRLFAPARLWLTWGRMSDSRKASCHWWLVGFAAGIGEGPDRMAIPRDQLKLPVAASWGADAGEAGSDLSHAQLGAVYTPDVLADWVADELLSLLGVERPCVLDPACGDGALLRAVQR